MRERERVSERVQRQGVKNLRGRLLGLTDPMLRLLIICFLLFQPPTAFARQTYARNLRFQRPSKDVGKLAKQSSFFVNTLLSSVYCLQYCPW